MPAQRVTIAEALDLMSRVPLRVAARECVTIADAAGRIIAESVAALEDVPPFARSRVDGYAVIAADIAGASPDRPAALRVSGEIRMGEAAGSHLERGSAMRVPTGGMLPDGADAVVMIEDARERDGVVEVRDQAHALDNITPAAGDVRAGQPLLDKGTRLDPGAVGLLAGAGVGQVEVYKRPAVALLVTGDEIVAPGRPLRPGEIRDINRYSLGAALTAMGFVVRHHAQVPDRREALGDMFAHALGECDAIVLSGGSSVGERDYVPDVVRDAGVPGVIVHGVRCKPGRPTLLGAIGDRPVVGLPGNPVSALVMLETLGRPVLLRLFEMVDDRLPIHARLEKDIVVHDAVEHRVPVKLRRGDDGAVIATPVTGTSAQMHILGWAHAIVAVPIGVDTLKAGSYVDAIPFTR